MFDLLILSVLYVCQIRLVIYITFNNIVWEPHYQNICKYSKPRQTTLMKYVHGWLANTSRKYKQGSFLTDECPMCGKLDTSFHMFQCTCSNMVTLHSHRSIECRNQIKKITLTGHSAVFFRVLTQCLGGIHRIYRLSLSGH